MQRLRELSEDECYLRCYGWVGEDDDVTVLRRDPQRVEDVALMTDRIRRAFEAKLERRDQEAA